MKLIKKHWKIILLTIFFIAYGVVIIQTKNNFIPKQYYIFCDYFRNLFYKTKNIFPNYGLNNNLYNYSFFGFLSPIILISYLFPFIKIKTYIIIISLLSIYLSIILFYKWINKKLNKYYSFIGTLLFLFSSPLLINAFKYINFIYYMPFLILGLIGVDNFFIKNKKSLLMLSTFLSIITSIYFIVGILTTIIIYGLYIYIKLDDKKIKDLIKFFTLIFISVLASSILLIPSLLNININLLKLITTNINNNFISNPFFIGSTSIILFSLIYSLINMKKEHKVLSIILLLLFIMEIYFYISTKFITILLIPMIPLYIFNIILAVDNFLETKTSIRKYVSIFIYIIISILMYIFIDKSLLFFIDIIITSIILVFSVFIKKYKLNLTKIIPIILILLNIITFINIFYNSNKYINYNIKNYYKELLSYNIKDNKYYMISNNLSNIKISKNSYGDILNGKINIESDEEYILSISYNKNFNIYIDNALTKYKKTNDSLIGLNIKKGKHDIKIIYNSKIQTLSKTLSISGLSIILFTFYIEYSFRKKMYKIK